MPVIVKKKEIAEEITRNSQQAKAVIFYNFHHTDNENIFLLKKKLKKVEAF
jgi:ribosomal protein L10